MFEKIVFFWNGSSGTSTPTVYADFIGVAAKPYKKLFGVRGSPKRAKPSFGGSRVLFLEKVTDKSKFEQFNYIKKRKRKFASVF